MTYVNVTERNKRLNAARIERKVQKLEKQGIPRAIAERFVWHDEGDRLLSKAVSLINKINREQNI